MFTIECQVERIGKYYFNYVIYLLKRKYSNVISGWWLISNFVFIVFIPFHFSLL